MLKTISPLEMKGLEQAVMAQTGVTSLALMETAASCVAAAVEKQAAGREGEVLCLCGTGNNGGDGLAAMRLLAAHSPAFQGRCLILEGSLTREARHQSERLQREAPHIRQITLTQGALPPFPAKLACIVDALFGTGLSRPLSGAALALCEKVDHLADQGVPVVAVDIPSGLSGTDGSVLGAAIKATETVTFHRPKLGLYLKNGLDRSGKLTVSDIGLPPELDDVPGCAVLEEKDISRLLPPRQHLSHKGVYGRVLLWAGSRGMAGAAAISATAALRTGAGLVTVACPSEVVSVIQGLCPCATCVPLPENDPAQAQALLLAACQKADAVGAGCGLGQSGETQSLLTALMRFNAAKGGEKAAPMVLDADGLNLLAQAPQASVGLQGCFLTPHPAEAARLLGWETAQVLADPIEAAKALRQRYGAAVALKGAATVLAAKEGLALNVLGTPAMAKGGSGDALTGVLTALLAGRRAGAYALTDLEALQVACGLHGLAGLSAERRYGQRGVLATDLCEFLGRDSVV